MGSCTYAHGKQTFKAEVDPFKYTSKTERPCKYCSSTTPSLEEAFTVPAAQKGATSPHPQN